MEAIGSEAGCSNKACIAVQIHPPEHGGLVQSSKDQKKEGPQLCGNVPQTACINKGMKNNFLVEFIK